VNYATTIAGKAHDLAVAHFGARFKTYRKTPALQVQPTDLPLLGIYILREQFVPWGAANHAEPKFETILTLGLSGGVHAETADQNQHLALEDWMSELLEVLLSNPKFVNLAHGVTGMDRKSQYAKVGETTLFEIRIEVADDFNTLHVETRFPTDTTDPDAVMQIVREYDLEQNS
jgi:hypothetical protein